MRFYLTSLGCKLNQAEIETLSRQARALGHEIVDDPLEADWAVVNTCTVTHVAARKSRRLVSHLHRQNPALRVAVVGCYAEMAPESAEALLGVSLVIGNQEKESILSRIAALEGGAADADDASADVGLPAPMSWGHTRALLQVQDGCDNRCTYCIVTIARGRSRSRPIGEVLREAQAREAEGYQEIVLTGINIGAYGRDLHSSSLAALVRELLARTAIPRLRLSSIEPWDLDEALIELLGEERVCRHLHLPLQSGCDATLRRMGRHYTTNDYRSLVERSRAAVPELGLTTDVMVGFPGETEKEFRQSAAFIRSIGFSRLHVFRYSPRPGTVAARLPDQVDPRVAHRRSEALIGLGHELSHAFHERLVGQRVHVLFESAEEREGIRWWSGWTDNYVRVQAASPHDLHNHIGEVQVESVDEEGLRGSISLGGPHRR